MRPLRKTQEPHHFLKRWPREKRLSRGPSEYVELIAVELTRGALLDTNASSVIGPLKQMLKTKIQNSTRRGWSLELLEMPTFTEEHYKGRYTATQRVKFSRL